MTLSRSLFLAAALPLLAFGVAFAQDSSIEAGVDAEVNIETRQPKPLPLRPLDALREARNQRAAQQATSSNERPTPQQRMETQRERMASSTVSVRLRALAQRHGGLIRERFSNAIAHLEKFMARIDSRIDKLSAEGVDVSTVVALQADAELSIASAKSDIAAVRDYVAGITDESNRETVKSELKPLIETAQESIREAHAAVKAVIKALVDVAKNNRATTVEVEADAEASVETQ